MSRPNILYVSLWPWDGLWQRPQHLAQQLSEHCNVIYTSPTPFHSRRDMLPHLGRGWKLKRHEETERLHVLDFPFLPSWRFSSLREWNHCKWASAVSEYIKRERIPIDILWLSSPEQLPFCGEIPARLVCYDCMDNYESFYLRLVPFEQELFRKADLVFVSALSLEEKARKYSDKVHLVPNGVEVEHFRTVLEKSHPVPVDMINIPTPRIGYYGSIADWMDFEIIERLGQTAGASVVLVGPVHTEQARRLAERGIIFLLGTKPYCDLPAYLSHFSVCILPFRDTELTRAIDPVKVYEYLAAGKDVVATPLPALDQHADFLVLSQPSEFCESVRATLRSPALPELRARRSAAMSAHSWKRRAEQIRASIMNVHINDSIKSLEGTLCCPECKGLLVESGGCNVCQGCRRQWPIIEGIPSFVSTNAGERSFYEEWHKEQSGNRRNGRFRQKARRIVKPLRYFTARRERLFSATFAKHKRGSVLDLACGTGQPMYCELGPVTGVDLSMAALRDLRHRGIYERVVQADAKLLPFPDASFAYIVSSDFIGHVPIFAKDRVLLEMRRVLAPDGVMVHVVETDSTNICFRFAHRYPDLFKKYFVEQIGGHYGLEMPTEVVQRFKEQGFRVVRVAKMWGPVWDTRQYVTQFGNEYLTYSRILKLWVAACRLLSSNPLTMIMADAFLGAVSNIVDRLQPLDDAQGIFLVAQKIS